MMVRLVACAALAASVAHAATPSAKHEFILEFFGHHYFEGTEYLRKREDEQFGYHNYQTRHFDGGNPELIRISFHECVGQCNGCLNFNTTESATFNSGLEPTYNRIKNLYKIYTAYLQVLMDQTIPNHGDDFDTNCLELTNRGKANLGAEAEFILANAAAKYDGFNSEGLPKDWNSLPHQLCSVWAFHKYKPMPTEAIISWPDFLHSLYMDALEMSFHSRNLKHCKKAAQRGGWWISANQQTQQCRPHKNMPPKVYGRVETNMENCGYDDADLPSDRSNFQDNLAQMQKVFKGITAQQFIVLYSESHTLGGTHKSRTGYESGTWDHYPRFFGTAFWKELKGVAGNGWVPECVDNSTQVSWFRTDAWRYVGRLNGTDPSFDLEKDGFRQNFYRPGAGDLGANHAHYPDGTCCRLNYIQPAIVMVPSDMAMLKDIPSNMTCEQADVIRENVLYGDKSLAPPDNEEQKAMMQALMYAPELEAGGGQGGVINDGAYVAVSQFLEEWTKMVRNGYNGDFGSGSEGVLVEQLESRRNAALRKCENFWTSRSLKLNWWNDKSRDEFWKERKGFTHAEMQAYKAEQNFKQEKSMLKHCYNAGVRTSDFKSTTLVDEILVKMADIENGNAESKHG